MSLVVLGSFLNSLLAFASDKPTRPNPVYYVRYISQASVFNPSDLGLKQSKHPIVSDRGMLCSGVPEDAMPRFLSIALGAGHRIDSDLRWALSNGRPAGKLYAALLIRQYDRQTADHALRLLGSHECMGQFAKLALEDKLTPGLASERLYDSAPCSRTLDSELLQLALSRTFEPKLVGFTAVPSHNFALYERARKRAHDIVPQLQWIVEHGSPAGQLYAALCLQATSQSLGTDAFARLSKSTELVSCQGGCVCQLKKVSELANASISGKKIP